MSGQLGDSEKIPQLTPVSAKPGTLATKKAVTTVPTQKPKMETTSIKMEIMATAASAQIKIQPTRIPTTAKISPVTAEKLPLAASTAELMTPTMATVQQTSGAPKVDLPNPGFPNTVTEQIREESVKVELSEPEYPKVKESKPDLPKVKAEAGVASASSCPGTEATVVPTPLIAAEVVPGNETKTELSFPEKTIQEVLTDDHIELTEPTQSLPQPEVQPKTQEPQLVLEVEPVIGADSKKLADKLVEKIIDITLTPETQNVSTKNIIVIVSMGPLYVLVSTN